MPPWLYDHIAYGPVSSLLGEVLFAKALWGETGPKWKDYLAAYFRRLHADSSSTLVTTSAQASPLGWDKYYRALHEDCAELYNKMPQLIAEWATELIDTGSRIIGFSSTFQQNVAALALAQEIRRRVPKERISILFGGANCEGEMGELLARRFDFIDHVVSGEGERAITELVSSILEGPRKRSLALVSEAPQRFVTGKSVTELDALPIPDFSDYFAAHKELPDMAPPALTAETSRGCWWGAKSHCKFCGLNGQSMAYRSKSPERAISELRELRDRYGTKQFMMADNILDTHYFTNMLPALAGEGLDLFYEVKSNLKKDQLRVMRAAGVSWIQPGVESLSSDVLQRMGKGCTALQNIQMLRFCTELNIATSWNWLYGFPGEDEKEYAEMASFVADLCHLQPPAGVIPVRLDRFSPYFNRAAEEGVINVRPSWAYEFAYPGLTAAERHCIAYFFEYDYQDGRRRESYIKETHAAVARWDDAYRAGARLCLIDAGERRFVIDARRLDRPETVPLSATERVVVDLLDSAQSVEGLEKRAAASGLAESELDAALAHFRRRRWVFQENNRIVRLITAFEP
jgi:ribosomal peptide maturation radical SAM protein 1